MGEGVGTGEWVRLGLVGEGEGSCGERDRGGRGVGERVQGGEKGRGTEKGCGEVEGLTGEKGCGAGEF